MILWHCRQFYEKVLVETKVLVNIKQKTTEFCNFTFNLFFRTDDMSIILNKATHTHDSMQSSAWLITNTMTKLCKSQRQVFVRASSTLENFKGSRTVHWFYSKIPVFTLGRKHIFLIMSPVTASFPKRFWHDCRSVDFKIAILNNLFSDIILQSNVHIPSVWMPENLTWIFRIKMEQIKLNSKFSMVSFLCFGKHRKVIFQIIWFFKTNSINSSKHRSI